MRQSDWTHLDMLLLAAVRAEPAHGYAIIEGLKARTEGRLTFTEGTVYPALRRLGDPGGAARAALQRMGSPGELAVLANARRAPWAGTGAEPGTVRAGLPVAAWSGSGAAPLRPRSPGAVYAVLSAVLVVLVGTLAL